MSLPRPSLTTAALVTGASAGLGTEFALQLAQRGYNLVLVARRGDQLTLIAKEIADEYQVEVIPFVADLTDPVDRADLLRAISSADLAVSILVNNAGFATGGPFADAVPEKELEQAQVLVEAPLHLTAALLPGMVAREEGAILNVASTAGMQPLPFSAGYSAAKAHTLTFSEALHHELRGRGVHVTALCPGPVRTEFWEVAGNSPMQRMVPRGSWVSPRVVVAQGLAGLSRNQRVVVPGTVPRVAARAGSFIPRGVKGPVMARLMRP